MKRILGICLISFMFSHPCFSKITPKDKGDKIVIRKGDTLWSLARKYYNDPSLWPKFNEFNLIDNPDLIHPGERLAIGKDLALSLALAMRGRMKRLEKEKLSLNKKIALLKKEIEVLKAGYEEKIEDLRKQLPPEEEMRLRHQAEIEIMENEILALQAELGTSSKEKAELEASLSKRINEIEEKKREIKTKEDEIKLLEDKLDLRDGEISLLKTGIFELEEKLKAADLQIEDRDKKISKLKDEKALYADLAHFLIFALASGIFALGVSN